ncbi:hypothetical protein BDW62DRAFT_189678 [Aspergillus aurantiobrunneus]
MDALPAPQLPPPNGDFRCGICNKSYSRRDLRDRHRRRCIKTIGQERLSKRKSCDTCAQKKLRCSMTRPACSRCLRIGTQCNYPFSAVPVEPRDKEMSFMSNAVLGAPDTIQPSLLQNLHHTDAALTNTTSAWSAFGAFAETPFPNCSHLDPVSWNEEFSTSSLLLGQDEGILGSINNQPTALSSSLGRFPPGDPGSQPVPPAMNNRAAVTMSSSSSNIGSSSDGVARQSYYEPPCIAFNPDSSPQLDFGRDFFPSTYNVEDVYQRVLGVVREYPSLILQRNHWSPFVHHRMYRCSFGMMPKPMGVALACVSAHAGSVGSNHGFVDNLINSERQTLVREFQSHLDTPENCLSAVHAVCIYQVLGLFGDNFLPAAITETRDLKEMLHRQRTDSERQAELHSSFVLKMTRLLYKHYRDAIETTHDNELNWERWKFSESLRRNIFFANIINILGAKAGRLNSAYFEPLDDELIANLPLPAPECMWRACTLREWLEAREHALTMAPSTDEEGSPRLTQTLRQLLRCEAEGKLDVSALLPLTRVVWASTKIAPGSVL